MVNLLIYRTSRLCAEDKGFGMLGLAGGVLIIRYPPG